MSSSLIGQPLPIHSSCKLMLALQYETTLPSNATKLPSSILLDQQNLSMSYISTKRYEVFSLSLAFFQVIADNARDSFQQVSLRHHVSKIHSVLISI